MRQGFAPAEPRARPNREQRPAAHLANPSAAARPTPPAAPVMQATFFSKVKRAPKCSSTSSWLPLRFPRAFRAVDLLCCVCVDLTHNVQCERVQQPIVHTGNPVAALTYATPTAADTHGAAATARGPTAAGGGRPHSAGLRQRGRRPHRWSQGLRSVREGGTQVSALAWAQRGATGGLGSAQRNGGTQVSASRQRGNGPRRAAGPTAARGPREGRYQGH